MQNNVLTTTRVTYANAKGMHSQGMHSQGIINLSRQ